MLYNLNILFWSTNYHPLARSLSSPSLSCFALVSRDVCTTAGSAGLCLTQLLCYCSRWDEARIGLPPWCKRGISSGTREWRDKARVLHLDGVISTEGSDNQENKLTGILQGHKKYGTSKNWHPRAKCRIFFPKLPAKVSCSPTWMHQEKSTGPKRHFAGENTRALSVFFFQDTDPLPALLWHPKLLQQNHVFKKCLRFCFSHSLS